MEQPDNLARTKVEQRRGISRYPLFWDVRRVEPSHRTKTNPAIPERQSKPVGRTKVRMMTGCASDCFVAR